MPCSNRRIGSNDVSDPWIPVPGLRHLVERHALKENFAKPLTVETLADMAALSVSAFHRHFKAVTALSPIQYQKQVRLLHARTRLLAGDGNATSVAFDVGYESPNQFSREYARQFGLPPSKDVRRLKGRAA